MQIKKEQLLLAIQAQALRDARRLSGEFARAVGEDREMLFGALRFEQWLVHACDVALQRD
jgi:hypothetical protein